MSLYIFKHLKYNYDFFNTKHKGVQMMKLTMFFFALIMANTVNAQSGSGRDFCSQSDLKKLTVALDDMKSEEAFEALAQARVGSRIGDCEPYSLQKIAKKNHRTDAPPPFCGLVLILSSNEKLASKQAIWILDNLGNSYTTAKGFKVRFCGKYSSGAGPRPGVTVRN